MPVAGAGQWRGADAKGAHSRGSFGSSKFRAEKVGLSDVTKALSHDLAEVDERLTPLLARPSARPSEIWAELGFYPLHHTLAETCSLPCLARARQASHSMKRLCEAALSSASVLVLNNSATQWWRVAFFLKHHAPNALLSAPRHNWLECGACGLAAMARACPSLRLFELVATAESFDRVALRGPRLFSALSSLSLVGRAYGENGGELMSGVIRALGANGHPSLRLLRLDPIGPPIHLAVRELVALLGGCPRLEALLVPCEVLLVEGPPDATAAPLSDDPFASLSPLRLRFLEIPQCRLAGGAVNGAVDGGLSGPSDWSDTDDELMGEDEAEGEATGSTSDAALGCLPSLLAACPHLEGLALRETTFPRGAAASLVASCTRLERLDLHWRAERPRRVADHSHAILDVLAEDPTAAPALRHVTLLAAWSSLTPAQRRSAGALARARRGLRVVSRLSLRPGSVASARSSHRGDADWGTLGCEASRGRVDTICEWRDRGGWASAGPGGLGRAGWAIVRTSGLADALLAAGTVGLGGAPAFQVGVPWDETLTVHAQEGGGGGGGEGEGEGEGGAAEHTTAFGQQQQEHISLLLQHQSWQLEQIAALQEQQAAMQQTLSEISQQAGSLAEMWHTQAEMWGAHASTVEQISFDTPDHTPDTGSE